MNSFLLIFLSAMSYLLAMIYPVFAIVGITTFIIPLILMPCIRWWHGFLWGCITFGIHTSWLLILMHQKALGLQGYLFWLLLVLWFSCLSAIWFHFLRTYPISSTVLFFLFMIRYSLIIGGVVDGYPLCNPIVALAQHPSILYHLYWLHDAGYFAVLFGLQVAIVQTYRFGTKRSLVLLLMSFGLFGSGYFLHQESSVPQPRWGVVCPWWYNSKDPMFAGYRMAHDISVAAQKHKDLEAIILPESSFCWDMHEYHQFVSIWLDSADGIPIIFGGHCIESDITHNCVFLLHNGVLGAQYFKQHKMPLVERSLYVEKWIGSLLTSRLQQKNIETPSYCDTWKIGNQLYQVFICSELFFESKQVKNIPILLLWNDTWLCCNWTRHLAQLFIVYFQQKYRVKVYHVSTLGEHNCIR